MKMWKSLLIALFTGVVLGPAAADTAWKKVQSQGFEALMPGSPQVAEHKTDSLAGTVNEKRYCVENEAGSYTLSATELPGVAMLFGGGSQGILDQATSALLESDGRQKVSAQDLDYQGQKGRKVTYRLPDGTSGEALLVIANNRLYVLDAQAKQRQNVQKFLSSLKLSV